CDGPLFAGQNVAVIGGGNAGFESAAQLLAYCQSVTLVHRSDTFSKADPSTVEAVMKDPKFTALTNAEPAEVKGGTFVSGLTVKNRVTGVVTELPVTGIFVEIGMLPSTDLVKELVALNEFNRVKVDPKTPHTSLEGVWAAATARMNFIIKTTLQPAT